MGLKGLPIVQIQSGARVEPNARRRANDYLVNIRDQWFAGRLSDEDKALMTKEDEEFFVTWRRWSRIDSVMWPVAAGSLVWKRVPASNPMRPLFTGLAASVGYLLGSSFSHTMNLSQYLLRTTTPLASKAREVFDPQHRVFETKFWPEFHRKENEDVPEFVVAEQQAQREADDHMQQDSYEHIDEHHETDSHVLAHDEHDSEFTHFDEARAYGSDAADERDDFQSDFKPSDKGPRFANPYLDQTWGSDDQHKRQGEQGEKW